MIRFLTIFVFFLVLLWGAIAFAKPDCMSRNDIVDRMNRKWQEKPAVVALSSNKELVEILTSDYGETWTIIVTNVMGCTRVVASGESWKYRRIVIGEPL